MHVDVHGGLFREITCQTRHAILRAMVHDHEDDVQSRDPAEDRPPQCSGRLGGTFFEFLPAAGARRLMDPICSPSAIIDCIYQNGSRGH